MPYEVYKVIHLLGIFLLLISLSGMAVFAINGGAKKDNVWRVRLAISHGVGLFLVLLGGFGMLARLGITAFPWPGWVYGKFAFWLVFGGLIALATKNPKLGKIVYFLLPILAILTASLAIYKPF